MRSSQREGGHADKERGPRHHGPGRKNQTREVPGNKNRKCGTETAAVGTRQGEPMWTEETAMGNIHTANGIGVVWSAMGWTCLDRGPGKGWQGG
jgi:hypothetical protein